MGDAGWPSCNSVVVRLVGKSVEWPADEARCPFRFLDFLWLFALLRFLGFLWLLGLLRFLWWLLLLLFRLGLVGFGLFLLLLCRFGLLWFLLLLWLLFLRFWLFGCLWLFRFWILCLGLFRLGSFFFRCFCCWRWDFSWWGGRWWRWSFLLLLLCRRCGRSYFNFLLLGRWRWSFFLLLFNFGRFLLLKRCKICVSDFGIN